MLQAGGGNVLLFSLSLVTLWVSFTSSASLPDKTCFVAPAFLPATGNVAMLRPAKPLVSNRAFSTSSAKSSLAAWPAILRTMQSPMLQHVRTASSKTSLRMSTEAPAAQAAGIYSRVADDIKVAMKAKDSQKLNALRGIRSALLAATKAEGKGDNLTDDECFPILRKLAKQRQEVRTFCPCVRALACPVFCHDLTCWDTTVH
jgi:hypothetical protein